MAFARRARSPLAQVRSAAQDEGRVCLPEGGLQVASQGVVELEQQELHLLLGQLPAVVLVHLGHDRVDLLRAELAVLHELVPRQPSIAIQVHGHEQHLHVLLVHLHRAVGLHELPHGILGREEAAVAQARVDVGLAGGRHRQAVEGPHGDLPVGHVAEPGDAVPVREGLGQVGLKLLGVLALLGLVRRRTLLRRRRLRRALQAPERLLLVAQQPRELLAADEVLALAQPAEDLVHEEGAGPAEARALARLLERRPVAEGVVPDAVWGEGELVAQLPLLPLHRLIVRFHHLGVLAREDLQVLEDAPVRRREGLQQRLELLAPVREGEQLAQRDGARPVLVDLVEDLRRDLLQLVRRGQRDVLEELREAQEQAAHCDEELGAIDRAAAVQVEDAKEEGHPRDVGLVGRRHHGREDSEEVQVGLLVRLQVHERRLAVLPVQAEQEEEVLLVHGVPVVLAAEGLEGARQLLARPAREAREAAAGRRAAVARQALG
eukprot:CAMPEP_0195085840 /NCGR_PEP_ID=MMETSP0448-20130528/26155_1 /TAXON_ID=66468 /ORGANISM="Heterocapsa triquestra, Strain CCMP 448" /LENGTH=490 /DNA_ID=CAMNT_0040119257 /DNA_START=77 /DNA_END=1545 /DNA_ORIENTATION=-